MKQTLLLLPALLLFIACNNGTGKKGSSTDGCDSITISGKVQFDDPQFKMQIEQQNGFDKKIIGEFDINSDGTYKYTMAVEEPGLYTLNCKNWQAVDFWAENENLEIDFRGYDTAKMKIKNPPYVLIKGGPLNEVMNDYNFNSYRTYQLTIGINQNLYQATVSSVGLTLQQFMDVSSPLYTTAWQDEEARNLYLAEKYSDRNSVLAILSRLNPDKNGEFIDKIISHLESVNPNYAPLLKYKAAIKEERFQKERLAIGKPAPEFSFPTPDGKMIGPKDFKGKLLVIDFWASWCGPCRQEIPHVKEVYAKYKNKGVDVLSVSIDKKESDWKKALDEEKMSWTQVCAPNAGSDIMKEYQFSGIPYIILLDENGNILAKDLRGNDIDKAIDAALANKK